MQQGSSRGEGGPGDGQTKITESDNRLSNTEDRKRYGCTNTRYGCTDTQYGYTHTLHCIIVMCRRIASPGNIDDIKMCRKFSKKTKVFYLLVKFDSV